MNQPTLDQMLQLRFPEMTRFDSNLFQTPDFKTTPSRQSDLSYPEISLNYEPSFAMSTDAERCSFLPELTMNMN
jgi:hypothetical protein